MSTTLELLKRIHAEDCKAVAKLAAALPSVAEAAEAIAARLEAKGRWLSVGAGTSGRLAALDAAELPPTFGTSPDLVRAFLAGGDAALRAAVEGAEDEEEMARRTLDEAGLTAQDAVVGVSASGTTPFVLSALAHARARGALTVAIVTVAGSPLAAMANRAIVVDVGPEVLKGSTRMKAGTVQKMILTMLSTAVMARRGLVYRDEMVALRPTNEKLKKRAVRIVSELLHKGDEEAAALLMGAGWDVPVALVAGRHGLAAAEARQRLEKAGGNVARLLRDDH